MAEKLAVLLKRDGLDFFMTNMKKLICGERIFMNI
jgi:hypothetical protein